MPVQGILLDAVEQQLYWSNVVRATSAKPLVHARTAAVLMDRLISDISPARFT